MFQFAVVSQSLILRSQRSTLTVRCLLFLGNRNRLVDYVLASTLSAVSYNMLWLIRLIAKVEDHPPIISSTGLLLEDGSFNQRPRGTKRSRTSVIDERRSPSHALPTEYERVGAAGPSHRPAEGKDGNLYGEDSIHEEEEEELPADQGTLDNGQVESKGKAVDCV